MYRTAGATVHANGGLFFSSFFVSWRIVHSLRIPYEPRGRPYAVCRALRNLNSHRIGGLDRFRHNLSISVDIVFDIESGLKSDLFSQAFCEIF